LSTTTPPPPEATASGADSPGESARGSDALETAVERLTEVVDGLQRLIEVRVARARVELREKTFRSVGWLLFAALLATLVVSSSLYLLRGVSGLFASAFGSFPWAAELLTGFTGLGLALIVALVMRGRVRRRNLERMRERMDPRGTRSGEAS
jgi:hypothetical protein